jgi:catecholate siderophore receptor
MHVKNSPRQTAPTMSLAAAMLAGSVVSGMAAAQTAPAEKTLPTVTVKERADTDIPEGKNSVRATETRIGKGRQALRDIPQSVTVITERIIDDRNLDTMKEALKNTAGVSFLAAEGGEEDIRLRGFSLQASGDVFLDGVRDPAFYERDTFNLDRLEVLRGSASMLFGRGSTGGAVNQVSKIPRLMDENQVDLTLGSHQHRRVVVDLNKRLTDSAALRVSGMHTTADNNGAGSSLDKSGFAGAFRWGIGEAHEFQLSAYVLNNRNGMNYGMPWIQGTTVLPLDPSTYYGMSSDRNNGQAQFLSASHTWRTQSGGELKTQIRKGHFERDQRAGTVRFANASLQPGGAAVSLATLTPQTVITRGTQLKIQNMDNLHVQSDFDQKFKAWGMEHALLAGVDLAREHKDVFAARTAGAQGGVTLTKPTTLFGTPNDGAWVNENLRVLRTNNYYDAKNLGAYVQDTVSVSKNWKLVGGLRYDRLEGDFASFAAPSNASSNGAQTDYSMNVGEVSKRVGVLYQPDALKSFHLSYGTSFNTSGDTYSLSAANQSIAPEKSTYIELGAKIDSADKRFTTRFAIFKATKENERNTDPLVSTNVLTGQRHVTGFEIDVSGRPLPKWEVFGSFTWLPDAKVDKAAPCPATGACLQSAAGDRVGDRPALTPLYSGTAWNTYQVTSKLRLGTGLTFRGRQTALRQTFSVKSFVVADLMAEYVVSNSVTLKANVSNVTNRNYADQLYAGHYIPGAGRLFQLTASYKF